MLASKVLEVITDCAPGPGYVDLGPPFVGRSGACTKRYQTICHVDSDGNGLVMEAATLYMPDRAAQKKDRSALAAILCMRVMEGVRIICR